MKKISACLVVYNEEQDIKFCLESIKNVVDEIIVVHDGECRDKTLEICRLYTDKIFIRDHLGEAEPHRPFCLKQTTGDWILQIDADEFLSPELNKSLRGLISEPNISGFAFRWRLFDQDKKKFVFGPKQYKETLFKKTDLFFIGVPHYALHSRGTISKSDLVLGHNFKKGIFLKKRFARQKYWAKLQAGYLVRDFSEIEHFQATEDDWRAAFRKTKNYSHPLIIPFIFTIKLFRGLLGCQFRFSFPILKAIYSSYLIYYVYYFKKKNQQKLKKIN